MNPRHRADDPLPESGVAIIIVLAMVFLLTTIIVAFFSRAVLDRQMSSSNGKKDTAEILARGALDEVVGDLRQEITAGSTLNTYPAGSPTLNSLTLYLPKAATAMAGSTIIPALVPPVSSNPAPPNPPNVLKRSAAGQPFFSGMNYDAAQFPPSNSASAVNSAADPSPDGRYVSAARWNLPLLLDGGRLGDAAKSAAVYGSYFAAPDWVLVTRGGPKAIGALQAANTSGRDPANLDYVVGRYAYMIYDEGSLIDINHAGYPNLLSSDTDFTARRGRLAQIDLTQIPGVAKVDAIVRAFRNIKTAADATSYKKYVLNNVPANAGFLRVIPGDQTFVSRQDLLNFQQQNSSVLASSALQYLGTFSRTVNAPSWKPPADATELPTPVAASNGSGNVYAYRTNAENGAAANKNPDVATVRFANAGTIAATALLPARVVAAGEPMLKRRFSLNYLSWIGIGGPANGAAAADIKRAFGLKFVSTGVWMYTSPDGDTLATTIKGLNEIAALPTPREPDFFELLQAGILSGSLGLYSGDRNYADTQREDKSVTRQIMQIGVNIIDQYDADSFPTTIQFDFKGDSPIVDARYAGDLIYMADQQSVVGVEDLPYFSQIGGLVYRDQNGNSTTNEQLYMPIELWNPHQPSPAVYVGPTKLRICVRAGTSYYKKDYNSGYSEYPRNFSVLPATIEFPSVNGVSSIFREPGVISVQDSSTATEINNTLAVPAPISANWQTILGAHGKPFSGVPNQEFIQFGAVASTPNDLMPMFELQFLNTDQLPVWQTYQYFPSVVPTNTSQGQTNNISPPDNSPTKASLFSGFRADPRGMRLGFSQSGQYTTSIFDLNLGRSSDPTGTDSGANGLNGSYWGLPKTPGTGPIFYSPSPGPFTGGGYTNLAGPFTPPYFAENREQPKNGNNVNSYTDRDQVMRWGDGDRLNSVRPMMPNRTQDRPIVLNRPFRSVGELGYVYRDMQWKTLDFTTIKSADAALLDLFTVDDADVVAGKINLNTRQPAVLQALLTGAAKTEAAPSGALTSAEAAQIATALTNTTSAPPPYGGVIGGPLANPAELVTRPSAVGNSTNWIADVTNSATTRIKTQREAAVRILGSAGETRTWNLLIDLIAQSGHFTSGATRLDQFAIGGERRYWLHVAIDRYTGKIVDQQLETVNE